MHWKQRERLLLLGAPLAIIPALAFLPAFAYLVLTPSLRHATLMAAIVFPFSAVSETAGLYRLVRCCVLRPFDLVTAFAFSAVMVLLVIAAYTGFFLAALAAAV